MKKLIITLLSLALIFAFCACGNDDADIRGTIIGNDTDNVADTTNNETADTTADATVDTQPEEEGEDLSLGVNDGAVYESKFIGLGYALDEGWIFYNDDQIKELNNITSSLAGEEYEEIIKNATLIYDMYATDAEMLNNININLEKVDHIQLIALDIAANFELIAPTIKTSFENMGYTNFSYEIAKVTVDGVEMDAMKTTAEIQGIKMFQTMFQKKCNGYLANIAVTSFVTDSNAELIENFYWLE